jgi:hypothetical protein
MAEPRLQRPHIVPVHAAKHMRTDGKLHARTPPKRVISVWKLFGAIGPPRSEANTGVPWILLALEPA